MATSLLNPSTLEQLSRRANEPAWLAQARAGALKQHAELPWPHASDEVWRRTDARWLDPSDAFSLPEGNGLLESMRLSEAELARWTRPLADEHLVVRANGSWVDQHAPPGVSVWDLAKAANERGEVVRSILEADGMAEGERKLASLNLALHHDAIFVEIPAGFMGQVPLRLVRLVSARAQSAVFPMTIIAVGRGSSVTLIEEDVGITGADSEAAHLINGRIELLLEPQASAHYCRIQRWAPGAREFLLQRATLREGASLTMVNINFGATISKTHVVVNLAGRQASSRVFGFVFGHGRQHVDFHSLQDHQAPQTTSDLLYKAALKDESRMIYTGLIRIAKPAQQTNAYQANHNLLLSGRAKAETIPMLEILADDVACKHGATVGPVDEDQLFYLMTRGVDRTLAERLLVMGFVEPVIGQVPFEPMRERLREELEGSLHA